MSLYQAIATRYIMSILSSIENNRVVVISKEACIYCVWLKELLNIKKIPYVNIGLEVYMEMFDDDDFIFGEIEYLKLKWNIKTYPMTFIDGEFIGDYTAIEKMNTFGELDIQLKNKGIRYIPNEDVDF